MRALGIDYGEKRIGLAYGDELGVATPLGAAVEPEFEDRLSHIESEIKRRSVDTLVVGYPYNMDGSVGFKAREVDEFIQLLEKRFSLPVNRVDERLTSQVAESALGLKGQKERQKRKTGIVDSTAASVILQDWLDMQLPPPPMEEWLEEGFD